MKIVTALLLFFALAIPNLHAKPADDKWPVLVSCTIETDDYVGQRLCSALRDDIARSPRYYEVTSDEATYYWVLHIVSMTTEGSSSSSQAVVLTIHMDDGTQLFLNVWTYLTGKDRVREQAETILASADTQAQGLKAAIARRKTTSGGTEQ